MGFKEKYECLSRGLKGSPGGGQNAIGKNHRGALVLQHPGKCEERGRKGPEKNKYLCSFRILKISCARLHILIENENQPRTTGSRLGVFKN